MYHDLLQCYRHIAVQIPCIGVKFIETLILKYVCISDNIGDQVCAVNLDLDSVLISSSMLQFETQSQTVKDIRYCIRVYK